MRTLTITLLLLVLNVFHSHAQKIGDTKADIIKVYESVEGFEMGVNNDTLLTYDLYGNHYIFDFKDGKCIKIAEEFSLKSLETFKEVYDMKYQAVPDMELTWLDEDNNIVIFFIKRKDTFFIVQKLL